MAGFLDTIFNWLPKLRKPDQTLADAQCDDDGNLKIAVVTNAPNLSTWVDPASASILTYKRVVSGVAKKLHQIIGVNEGASTRWFMVFNLTSDPPPNTSEPIFAFPVPAGQSFSLDLPRPRSFSTGIVWAISSTPGTLTIDVAATFRVNVEVE